MNGHFGYRHDSFHCIGSAEQQKKKIVFWCFIIWPSSLPYMEKHHTLFLSLFESKNNAYYKHLECGGNYNGVTNLVTQGDQCYHLVYVLPVLSRCLCVRTHTHTRTCSLSLTLFFFLNPYIEHKYVQTGNKMRECRLSSVL